MSCGGNRFQCALTKSTRFQFKPDKPSNPELHNENQQRLNALLKAREEIDNQFIANIKTQKTQKQFDDDLITNNQLVEENIKLDTGLKNTDYPTNTFTPWKTPSVSEFQPKTT